MIGNATTADAIVERVLDIVEALTPTQSPGAGKFRRYRGEGDGDFITWAEASPESAFRRVDARHAGTVGVPVSVNDYEEREIKVTVIIAYPNNARAGKEQTRARDAMIGSDLDQLERAIGLYSRANFSTPNPEACFRGWDSQRVAQAACTYLVVDVIYAFNQAVNASTLPTTATGVIACWGDSLTAGALITAVDSDHSYPARLAVKNPPHVVFNGGVPGDSSTQIKTRLLADTNKLSWPTVIWAGRNNFSSPSTVLADVAAMVAALGHQKYLILGVINGDTGASEYSGGSDYNLIVGLNNSLAAAYGVRFIDIRSVFVAGYDPNQAQDILDHSRDVVPFSFRSDNVHLNDKGYQFVATEVWKRIGLLLGQMPTTFIGTPGVTIDPMSLRHMPADATEWGLILETAGITSGGPASAWPCFEKNSFALTDFVGHTALNVTGLPTGENQVMGWLKRSMNTADGSVGHGFSSASVVNLAATSALLLCYVVFNGVAAAERELAGLGSFTDHRYVAYTAAGKIKATGLAGASVTGTVSYNATFSFPKVPIVLKVDRAASAYRVYTDQEVLAPAWTNPGAGGALIEIGDAVAGGAAPVGYLYAALFTGAAAQLSDAQVRTLLQTLGWAVSW